MPGHRRDGVLANVGTYLDPAIPKADLANLSLKTETVKQYEPDEAVDEARMAVEHGMVALLDATNTPRLQKHQANNLLTRLRRRTDLAYWTVTVKSLCLPLRGSADARQLATPGRRPLRLAR